MKQLDTAEYVGVLRQLVEQGHQVSMRISGSSMAPFLIHHRDIIHFRKPDRPLRRGDMVFYQRRDGKFVMHRIRFVRKDGYYLIGDNQTQTEGPLDRDQIFAIVTAVERGGKRLEPGDFWWDFFASFWLRIIPLRGLVSKLYAIFT